MPEQDQPRETAGSENSADAMDGRNSAGKTSGAKTSDAKTSGAKTSGVRKFIRTIRTRKRRKKLLSGLKLKAMTGLEIGPLTAPLVTKNQGDILYVDHEDTESLLKKYAHQAGVDCKEIVPVDAVWGEATLADCLEGRKVDYVLASHVVEHVPDLITWFEEIAAVLKEGGSLRLAVPDKRFTFDILRAESQPHDVLDAYLRKTRMPLPRQVIEHFSLFRNVDRKAAWSGRLDAERLPPVHSLQEAYEKAEMAHSGIYVDTHCWVFTPESFVALGLTLAEMGRMPFTLEAMHPTERNQIEFITAMKKADPADPAVARSWARAL